MEFYFGLLTIFVFLFLFLFILFLILNLDYNFRKRKPACLDFIFKPTTMEIVQLRCLSFCPINLGHSSPRRLAGEKKSSSYNHKTTIWVSHEYYLNPEFHKILSRAF